jgi:hypothetical protein
MKGLAALRHHDGFPNHGADRDSGCDHQSETHGGSFDREAAG